MLLVDEPESSFDNMFLMSDVNELLKCIAESMPVVVVTHNSTIGATVAAQYVLYAQKKVTQQGAVHRLFTNYRSNVVFGERCSGDDFGLNCNGV